jgi:hypothetical protein
MTAVVSCLGDEIEFVGPPDERPLDAGQPSPLSADILARALASPICP